MFCLFPCRVFPLQHFWRDTDPPLLLSSVYLLLFMYTEPSLGRLPISLSLWDAFYSAALRPVHPVMIPKNLQHFSVLNKHSGWVSTEKTLMSNVLFVLDVLCESGRKGWARIQPWHLLSFHVNLIGHIDHKQHAPVTLVDTLQCSWSETPAAWKWLYVYTVYMCKWDI